MADTSADAGAALLSAIESGALEVHYQPQMKADGSALSGVEALVRLRLPDGGLAGPGSFLPAVENDAEIIGKLGEFVMRRACRDGLSWSGLQIAVNVSPLQFDAPGFVQMVEDVVVSSGLEPGRLELEVLETSWFAHPQKAMAVLKDLRTFGVKIAMDDFGTGYASLAALLQLPLDKLKIDKSFVSLSHEIRSASIIHSIIALARSIGLTVTAEGVETKEQQRFLRAAGCHALQGHLFSGAVPADAITAMLAGGTNPLPPA
ncbi:MAG: EAL domain-containing protein [Beijerinckiaceae bacterium]